MADTIHGLFLEAARHDGGRPFLHHVGPGGEHRLTYRDAAAVLAAWSQRLRSSGLENGDRVVVWTEEMVPSLLFDLACAHAGIVVVPLPSAAGVEAVAEMMERVSAKIAFATGEDAARLHGRGLRVACIEGPHAPPASITLAARPIARDDDLLVLERFAAEHGPDTVYMLQPTSGTTGKSKLVIRTHAAFVRAAGVMTMGIPRYGAERVLMVAAMTHGMGQYLMAIGLYLGAELVVPADIDTRASLAEVRTLDPTYICLTPRVLKSFCAQAGPEARVFGPGARRLFIGGAAPDGELMRRLAADGLWVGECYGASEMSLLSVTVDAWREGCVGRVLPDVKLANAPDGELLAWTPVLMKGYYGDEELTRRAFDEDGYYRTGDFLEVTSSGELVYRGRKRDVFNLHDGSNIYPGHIEERLEAIPGVRQAFLAGEQRPGVVALLVVEPSVPMRDELGYLDPASASEAYAAMAVHIENLHRELEASAHVMRFALLGRAFPPEVYQIVGHGKVRRDRAAFAGRYAPLVDRLYAPEAAGVAP